MVNTWYFCFNFGPFIKIQSGTLDFLDFFVFFFGFSVGGEKG